jgi:hypothetical protein
LRRFEEWTAKEGYEDMAIWLVDIERAKHAGRFLFFPATNTQVLTGLDV